MSDYLLEDAPLSPGVIYRLLSGSVCPRPIAWVSTQDKQEMPIWRRFPFLMWPA